MHTLLSWFQWCVYIDCVLCVQNHGCTSFMDDDIRGEDNCNVNDQLEINDGGKFYFFCSACTHKHFS